MAVRIELGGVFLGLVERHRQGGVCGGGVHRLVGVRGDAGKERAVRHLVADLRLGRRSFNPAARVQSLRRYPDWRAGEVEGPIRRRLAIQPAWGEEHVSTARWSIIRAFGGIFIAGEGLP